MLSTEKFDALMNSLRKSLTHCQHENFGRPFDKTVQYAFAADDYSALTLFNSEFKAWLYNATDQERLKVYVYEVYYPIVHYGILFACLERDYERRSAGNGRSRLSSESYALAGAYQGIIADTADKIRHNAAKYAKVNLVPFRDLMLDVFTPDGEYITDGKHIVNISHVVNQHAKYDQLITHGELTVDNFSGSGKYIAIPTLASDQTNTPHSISTGSLTKNTIYVSVPLDTLPADKNDKHRTEETQRVARRAIALLDSKISDIVQREKGKARPLSEGDIIEEALSRYRELAKAQRYAASDKSLGRYLEDIGEKGTIRNYAGQLVRQLRKGK